jgi:hypothetical protein
MNLKGQQKDHEKMHGPEVLNNKLPLGFFVLHHCAQNHLIWYAREDG